MNVTTRTKRRRAPTAGPGAGRARRADHLEDPLETGGVSDGGRTQPGIHGHRGENWKVAQELQGKIDAIRGLPGDMIALADALEEIDGAADAVAAAATLTQAAGDVAQAIDLYEQFQSQRHDMADLNAWLGRANQVLRSAEHLIRLANNEKLQQFLDNPDDLDAAVDWAMDAAVSLNAASVAVPNIPVIGGMLKGYLGAPAKYVSVVSGIIHARSRDLDNLSATDTGGNWSVGGVILFRGPLSRIVTQSTMGRIATTGLTKFILENRSRDGINLQKANKDTGLAHLILLIQRYAVSEGWAESAEDAGYWMRWVGGQA